MISPEKLIPLFGEAGTRKILAVPDTMPLVGTNFSVNGACYRVLSVGTEYPFPVVGIPCNPEDENVVGTPVTIVTPAMAAIYLEVQQTLATSGTHAYLQGIQDRLLAAVAEGGIDEALVNQILS